MATTTAIGAVDDSPYRSSLKYEEKIQRLRESKSQGFITHWSLRPEGVVIEMKTSSASALPISVVRIELVAASVYEAEPVREKLPFDPQCQCVTLPSLQGRVGTFIYEIHTQLEDNERTQMPDGGVSLESFFEKGIITISNNQISVRRD
jgi:hypothetical protein